MGGGALALVVTAMLVFARVAGLLMALPIFSAQGVPRSAVVFGALAVTISVLPGVQLVPEPERTPVLLFALVGEVFLGLLLGLSVQVMFSALAIGAEIMSMKMGLAMASMLNPLQRQAGSPISNLASWVAGIVFLLAGLHLRCIETVGESFQWAEPGAVRFPEPVLELFVRAVGTSFSLGLQLAGPLLALVWMVNLLVAILAKLAPKMNVFFSIGMTMSNIVGLILFGIALPWLITAHMGPLAAMVREVGVVLAGVR